MTMTRLALTCALVLTAALPAGASPSHCPPGLAKKPVPCVPPGQVGRGWGSGDRLEGEYVLIPRDDWDDYRLRPYDDSLYALVDDEIWRVARDTMILIEAVRIVDRALN
jgi:hypothetical protein